MTMQQSYHAMTVHLVDEQAPTLPSMMAVVHRVAVAE
jgi:hypothetical protein